MKKMTARQELSEQKRELIYTEAVKLFELYGYEKTTIQDICKATGLPVGSIYHFYDGKLDILKRFAHELIGEVGFELLSPTKENIKYPTKALLNYYTYVAECFEDIGPEISKHIRINYDKIWTDNDGIYNQFSKSTAIFCFIEKAQEAGTFDNSLSTSESIEYLQTACDGVLCSWVFSDGGYPLKPSMEKFLARLLITFQTSLLVSEELSDIGQANQCIMNSGKCTGCAMKQYCYSKESFSVASDK